METCGDMHKEKKVDHSGNHRGNTMGLKPQKIISYACHIYGLNGHKMTKCPKFTKM
jgi:hypothetical protein